MASALAFGEGYMQYSSHLLRHTRLIIGKNIHRYRSKQKLPLWKLARLTGVSEFLLDYYELGKNELPFVEMLKIACALNVRLEDLLDDENGKAPEGSVSAKSPSVIVRPCDNA
jgi:transcriptional regulator with XRE-family HTH domain